MTRSVLCRKVDGKIASRVDRRPKRRGQVRSETGIPAAGSIAMALKPHLIGGAWVEGTDAQDDINPSDLSDVVGTYARADRALAEQAIAAAKAAFPAWSRSTPQQRFDLLDAVGDEILKRRQELGELLAREEGKPLADGVGEAGARRADLQVLRRRGAASCRRAGALGPARASRSTSTASRSAWSG